MGDRALFFDDKEGYMGANRKPRRLRRQQVLACLAEHIETRMKMHAVMFITDCIGAADDGVTLPEILDCFPSIYAKAAENSLAWAIKSFRDPRQKPAYTMPKGKK